MAKRPWVIVFSLLAMAIAVPAAAQERTRPSAGSSGGSGANRGVAAAPSVGHSTAPSVSNRTVSSSSYGGSVSGMSNRNIGSTPNFGGPNVMVRNVPDLKGTSFYSYNQYLYWNDFLYQLRMRYMMDAMYFSRFYRNNEPLMTPRIQKLALRDPLIISRALLAAVDDLGLMLEAHDARQAVDKEAILDKVKEIRSLAKAIRNDDLLPYVDQRKDVDLFKGNNVDRLGLEAIEELRALAVDLNNQLRNMYDQTSTATISISALTQPSFESLSKGIDKVCKVLEKSAKRI
ncbi:MAG: hypothetical protein FJW35_05190 [Acidobacteria bacterium]|nr:hypothetical protein [Acidobacteriota bacterium]